MRLSAFDVARLAASAGLTGDAVRTAVAISGWNGSPNPGESGGDPGAVNRGDASSDGRWTGSFGLWQVRALRAEEGTGGTRDSTRLLDPRFNAHAMAEISGGGTNWRPWSVYTSGAYRANYDALDDGNGFNVNLGPVTVDENTVPGVSNVLDAGAAIASGVGFLTDLGNWRRLGLILGGGALSALAVRQIATA